MIALRYFCGFFLQITPYAFFCMYPFRDRFRLSSKKVLELAAAIFVAAVIPFSLAGQISLGGVYSEFVANIIFYIALLLYGVMYCLVIRAKPSEKLFILFVVMSYGFFVTSATTFSYRFFQFASDGYMYPPIALAITLTINLILAKPILMLMDRIRMMMDIELETRIWWLLCLLPILFMVIASIAQFSTTVNLDSDVVIPAMLLLLAVFALSVYGVFFSVMGYICRKHEEQRLAERMVESYRSQAESNEHIMEVHHEIRHHMNALSAYLNRKDYAGAQQYIRKFAEETEQQPFVTYTANALVNSILSEFAGRAKQCGVEAEYSIILGSKVNMEDIDLCRMLANLLENAVEGCKNAPEERRFIRLSLHAKGNFLYVNCENACDENRLQTANGRYKFTKIAAGKHGYGLKIIGEIAEKYNGILTVQVHNGIFTVTTNLCLDAPNTKD